MEGSNFSFEVARMSPTVGAEIKGVDLSTETFQRLPDTILRNIYGTPRFNYDSIRITTCRSNAQFKFHPVFLVGSEQEPGKLGRLSKTEGQHSGR